MVNVRNSNVDTILFIRSAEREHSGKYELVLQIENLEDRATIEIRVVGKAVRTLISVGIFHSRNYSGKEKYIFCTWTALQYGTGVFIEIEKPGPPVNVRVTDVWGFNAALEWEPPKDDGNCEVTGYTIQKADMKTKVRGGGLDDPYSYLLKSFKFLIQSTFLFLQEWFTVYEHNRRTNCTASDLIMGNEYMFRVYSENLCGLSEEPRLSKNTAVIAKTGATLCAHVSVCICIQCIHSTGDVK